MRGDAQRLLAVIDARVRRLTRGLARVETTWGEVAVADTGARTVDVYLYGSAYASEDFRIIGGAVPIVGTNVKVAIDKERGDRWVIEPIIAAGSSGGSGTSLDHDDLINVTSGQHHAQAHVITGADHTTSETDTSKVLKPNGSGGTAWGTVGSGTMIVQENDSTVDAAVTTFDFNHGLDVGSSPAGEANIAVDETELDHSLLGGTKTHASDTLSPTNLDLPTASSPSQTAEGRAVWDSDDDKLTVGTGSGRKTMVNEGAATSSGLTQASGKLLGRTTAGTGAIEEITPGSGLTLSAGSLALAAHHTTHEENGSDELFVENLGTGETDVDLYYKPDGSGGVTTGSFSGGIATGSSNQAASSGDVTTTSSLADVTGCSLSLASGIWIVAGVFDVLVNNSSNDRDFEGHLDSGGSDQSLVGFKHAGGLVNLREPVIQMWRLNLGSTTTVKLRAKHSGGAAGDFTVKANSKLVAWQAGQSPDTTFNIAFLIDGGSSAITAGVKGDLQIPFAATITSWTILCDQSGSIVIDIWKDAYANYPPVVGDSITASAKPTVTSATKATSSTLTGWTTSIAAGDTLRFNVDSATTVVRATLLVTIVRG
jgi:hypothetical protein